ncbi:hypothetical protein V6Z96_006492 [Aspergillus fumigatus]
MPSLNHILVEPYRLDGSSRCGLISALNPTYHRLMGQARAQRCLSIYLQLWSVSLTRTFELAKGRQLLYGLDDYFLMNRNISLPFLVAILSSHGGIRLATLPQKASHISSE